MAAIGNSKYSLGNAVDFLLSASFTMYWARHGLVGLNKVSVVASRGIDVALKACYFDTSRADSYAAKVAAFIPPRVSAFFSDDSGYNELKTALREVPDTNVDGSIKKDASDKVIYIKKNVQVYKVDTISLLISGLGLSLLSLLALEIKQELWRESHPIVNDVLSKISPFRMVLGQSWIANGIQRAVSIVRAKV